MNNLHARQPASIKIDVDKKTIHCQGNWTVAGLNEVAKKLQTLSLPETLCTLDGSKISSFDSGGAWVLSQWMKSLQEKNITVEVANFKLKWQQLIGIITEHEPNVIFPKPRKTIHNWLYNVGVEAHEKWRQVDGFLVLVGELALRFMSALSKPHRFPWPGIINTVDKTGFCALPILGLLSFLVGVVLAYQLGVQLKEYGASVYIVNLAGIAILREFGPLITAIIVAGRTGSAFTAQIGLMKVNEEIDALRTMGISPVERLVLTRILGLVIAFPLLIFWADLFGVLGSMVMAKAMLDISYYDFIMRFHQQVTLSNYLIGLSKAPVFAVLIATVGCYQGLQVSGSAESVGTLTTRSVVQGIFLIILADAAFSVLYTWAGI